LIGNFFGVENFLLRVLYLDEDWYFDECYWNWKRDGLDGDFYVEVFVLVIDISLFII
jgi:hypothetical protein